MNRLRLKKNALNNLKHPLIAPHLRAFFLERIVCTIRGFTVFHSPKKKIPKPGFKLRFKSKIWKDIFENTFQKFLESDNCRSLEQLVLS